MDTMTDTGSAEATSLTSTASPTPDAVSTATPPAPSQSETRSASPASDAASAAAPDRAVVNAASATPTSPDPEAAGAAQPEHDWKRRYGDLQSYAQKLKAEAEQVRKQYDGLGKPDELRAIMAERKKQEEAARLKPWNSGHQEHSRFQQLRSKAEDFRAKLARADTPEKKAMVQELYADDFTPEDIALITEAERDSKQLSQNFHSDPRGFLAEHVIPLIRGEFQQIMQFQQTQMAAQNWLSDPTNNQLLDKYAPDMERMLDPEIPAREKAVEFARMRAELDALKAKLGTQMETQAHSEAQRDALSRGPRSPATARGTSVPIRDPVAHLIAKGFKQGTEEFSVQLQKINAANRR
jgi:Skp family chaperone for outer membrane proteins